MPTVDVVVIGAGLAGMTAALALAEAGASVEVVARGHTATHWTSGGLDVAAPPGASSPADGVASLRTVPGHPYALLADEVAVATERLRGWLATEGVTFEGDLSSPIRPVPTSIGGARPAAILPSAQAAALAAVVARGTARDPRVPRLQGLLARSDRGEPHSTRRLGRGAEGSAKDPACGRSASSRWRSSCQASPVATT